MKKIFFFFLISSFLYHFVQAQGSNPCGKSWSEWRTGWNFSYGRVLYRLEFPSKSCNCGYNFVQIQHDFPGKALINLRLEGTDCDGKKYGERFDANIDGGTISNDRGDYHWFKSMPAVINVEVQFEQGDKKIRVVGDRSGTTTYINGMLEKEYNQKQQQEKAAANTSTSKPISVTGNSIGNTTKPGNNGFNVISGNSGTSSGTTGSSNSKTSITPNKPTTPDVDPAAVQRTIYKNMALDDLERSKQKGQSSIVQQMHLSNAMLTAQSSGDATTILQAQQMQAQATARNQQQLNESITGLAESTGNLLLTIQANKQKKEEANLKASQAYEQRKRNEARKVAEVEQNTAPQKKRSLQELQKGLEEASDSYGDANTNADKLLNALSWLWKWCESEKILNSKPVVQTDFSNMDNVIVLSEGYINASELSLMSANRIKNILGLDDLNEIKVVPTTAPKLLYPTDLPSKAKNNDKKLVDFAMVNRRDVSPEEYIDRRYLSLESISIYSLETIYKNLNGENSKIAIEGLWWISYFMDNYGRDSLTCVRDGGHKYRYWKGNSSNCIYSAGYTPQKKLETALIEGRLKLDSAIFTKRAEILPRAISHYQKTFDWYFSGPIRWLKLDTQPANLIRDAMWRYALALAAARNNLSSSEKDAELMELNTSTFIKYFEQYCQHDISRITQPLKLDIGN